LITTNPLLVKPSNGGAPAHDKPLLVFSHATGFNAATYLPLFGLLVDAMDIVALDSRGHGQSRLPCQPHTLTSWERYYQDLDVLLQQLGRPCFLAGHSIGGTCSLALAKRRADQVKGVVAMDPVFLDMRQGWSMRILKWLRRSDRFSLAAGAKRRKAVFPSAQDAYENYRQKRSFSSWPDHWLRAYTEAAFDKTADGVRLRCDPHWESRTFAMVEHAPWRHLKDNPVPALFLLAEKHSTCALRSQDMIRIRQPDWRLKVLPESSHFLPMEQTQQVAHQLVTFVKNHSEQPLNRPQTV
jgi:pimeloyl-ACP methyl ester carboxylesterase